MLIVCEGRETEPNYFDQLKREDWARVFFNITVKRGRGGSREQIAQFAVNQKINSFEDYDVVWCVLDVEAPNQDDTLEKALRILSENSITSCLSNPSFEVWFFSHFEKSGRVFYHCDAVIMELNKHWQKHFQADYDKADSRIFSRLAPRLNDALENSRWVRQGHHGLSTDIVQANSSTEVYRLVELIRTGREES